MSSPSEGKNVVILQHGWDTIYSDDKSGFTVMKCSNECFGDKSSIEQYVNELRSKKIQNLDSREVRFAPPFDGPLQIPGTDRYWARLSITFVYKSKLSGMYPLLVDLGLDTTSGIVIFEGREFSFLRSSRDIDDPKEWIDLQDYIKNSPVFAETGNLRRVWPEDILLNREKRILQLLPGAFLAYPMRIGLKECLKPSYLDSLLNILESVVANRTKGYLRGGAFEDLIEWTPVHEQLFIDLYNQGAFRPRVGIQKRSLTKFLSNLKNTDSPLKSYHSNTLIAHAREIQNTLDKFHESYIEKSHAGLEVDLAYSIVTTARELV
jgi:hypothetical protein